MPKKAKCWSFATGEKGSSVTVYEREPAGLLYARAFDRGMASGRGGYRRVSLSHRDRERAKTYAMEQAAKLRQGHAELLDGKATLSRVLAQYLTHRSPRKKEKGQREDRRKAEMWLRVLGSSKDPHRISLGEWEGFIRARTEGAINARGESVSAAERHPVRARMVQIDCLCGLPPAS